MRWTRRLAGAAAAAAVFAAVFLAARRVSLRWGATDDELRMPLPGDELLQAPNLTATRAISIAAPPSAVWPWLTQLGQNRGGFYSYDWLENLVGLGIHSADAIEPELQVRSVGDEVNLAPGAALLVAALDDGRALVLSVGVNGIDGTIAEAPFQFTCAFVLPPQPDASTRLVVRERYVYLTGWTGALVEPVEMVSWVMTERMLRGIRDRAERGPSPERA